MKTIKSKKTLVAALLAVMMLIPMTLSAQLFSGMGGGDDEEEGITNQSFGETSAPLGSGFAIFAVSAAGYALLKRRKNQDSKTSHSPKHLNHLHILLGLVMVSVLFTQCTKEPSSTVGNMVDITLSVGDGSKLTVTPSTGSVVFNEGDLIYVAYDGKYVGTLTCNNSGQFDGSLTMPDPLPVPAQPLRFYFLGNNCTTPTLTPGSTTSITANICNQTTSLPVISCAPSTENYSVGTTNYKAKLLNKCGLVKFTTEGYTGDGNLIVKGMNNMVTINLDSNSFSYSKYSDGDIKMNKTVDGYWAILLPQDDTITTACTSDGYTSSSVTMPSITINMYYTAGVVVSLTGPEFVDLGLPSGTKWATHNIGASSPEDYGDYFAWGEVKANNEPMDGYTGWSGSTNPNYVNGTIKTSYVITKYKWGTTGNVYYKYTNTDGLTALESTDDAAIAKWGGSWCMPTKVEFEELANNTYTSWTWTNNYNGTGTKGYIVTSLVSGYTDKSIFLPVTGVLSGTEYKNRGTLGYYLSSSRDTTDHIRVYRLKIGKTEKELGSYYRYVGYTIRPVYKNL